MSEEYKSVCGKIYSKYTENTIKTGLEESVCFIQRGYIIWTALYWLIGGLALTLPALAAMGVYDDSTHSTNRILAGCGALAGAFFGFLKVSENANNYDAATQLAWKAQCWFAFGKISNLEAAEILGQAMDIMKGSYSTISMKAEPVSQNATPTEPHPQHQAPP